MGITQKMADRLRIADTLQAQTLNESRMLLKEANARHDQATAEIEALAGKKMLTDNEKRKYAELQAVRQEAEKAYYLLNNILELHGQKG